MAVYLSPDSSNMYSFLCVDHISIKRFLKKERENSFKNNLFPL